MNLSFDRPRAVRTERLINIKYSNNDLLLYTSSQLPELSVLHCQTFDGMDNPHWLPPLLPLGAFKRRAASIPLALSVTGLLVIGIPPH